MTSVIAVLILFSYFNYGFCGKISRNTYSFKVSPSTIYSPKVISKTCLLKPDVGPCRGNISMYYYDPSSKACNHFRWGGCQGNGNRFDSVAECTDRCLSQPNAKPKRPKWCSLTFDYGFCFGALDRYYYDHLWKVCKKTLYSGCGGNRNNFYSFEQCESICRFGYGPLKTGSGRQKGGLKKVLIINPPNTTGKRGREQTKPRKAPRTTNSNVTL